MKSSSVSSNSVQQSIQKKIQKITDEKFKELYEFQRNLDGGSYGIVDVARRKQNNEKVCIKTLREISWKDTFESEYLIMMDLNHPNILSSYGFYFETTKKTYMIVSPFCERENLKKCLEEISSKNQAFKIKMCWQIAKGLQALHDKNYMHRDIKPQNIVITQEWVPKLCDFGFSKYDNDFQKTVKIGTPIYRDPNIDSGVYSKKCDIYSLGLVFFSIFSGGSPIQVDDRGKLDSAVKNFQKESKEKVNQLKNCPDSVKFIMKKCLQKFQYDRWDSQMIVKKLEEVLLSYFAKKNIFEGEQYLAHSGQIKNQIKQRVKIKKQQQFKLDFDAIKKVSPDHPNTQRCSTEGNQNKNRKSEECSIVNNIFKTQLITKKKDSFKNSGGNQCYLHLLRGLKHYDEQLAKNVNSQKLHNFLIQKKNAVRKVNVLLKQEKIKDYQQRLLVFVILFGYFRFLFETKNFLANRTKNKDKNFTVASLTFEQLSSSMIQNSQKFVEGEMKQVKQHINQYLTKLKLQIEQYQNLMSNKVKHMICQLSDKSLVQIQKFDKNEIKNEYEQILKRNEYLIKQEDKIEIKKIINIFF